MPYNVQEIINGVSQDCRTQLDSTTVGQAQTALIDYTNRIQKEMQRWSNWDFMISDPQYFITELGQTDYWIGPTGSRPAGTVDTTLNLTDVDKIRKDSVRDMSNFRALKWFREAPIGPVLTFSSGMSRPGQPAAWRQDPNSPNILSIYPAPNNENTYQPVPSTPVIDTATSGALAQRVYFFFVTLVDSEGKESAPCSTAAVQMIPINKVAIVRSPKLVFGQATNGIAYSAYNVYAVNAVNYPTDRSDPGTETLQNLSPITIGTDWQEPPTGLTTSGASRPTSNMIEPIGGYIIQFRYFKARTDLTAVTDVPQIPIKYKDVLINGVSAMAWDLIGDKAMAQKKLEEFKDGYRQMVVDKNLFPEGVEFMRPDANSYVNQQILGYLPPFF